MRSRNAVSRRYSKLATLVIIVSCVLFAGILYYRSTALKERRTYLESQKASIQADIDEAKDEYTELEKKEVYMQTKKYVEEVARNQLGLVYPDETVIRAGDKNILRISLQQNRKRKDENQFQFSSFFDVLSPYNACTI